MTSFTIIENHDTILRCREILSYVHVKLLQIIIVLNLSYYFHFYLGI